MSRSAVSLARLLPTPEPAPADAPLLRAFEATHSTEAFEELVRRHGPMVLATCRRILGNPADADDAFQAVFLVLARKASTVRGNLAGWLYAVSVRTARGVRIMRQRRRKHETRASTRSESVVLSESDHDLAAVIDEELARLPEHYRTAVVLCELRGLSRKQAASELGIPEGTLSGRLAVAKRKLAALLSARGLAPAAAVALLAPASVSAGLVESAVLTVRGTAGPVVSAAASAVVKGMLFDQLKAVALAAGILLTVACGGFAMTGSGEQPAPAAAPAPRLVGDPTAKLVEQLGSPEFTDREAAQMKLRELGMKAEPMLRAALRSDNPEVRGRAARVLGEIRGAGRAALVKEFDPAKDVQPDHPLWRRFSEIAGNTPASRDVFARIIGNPKWLRQLDDAERDPDAAARLYREEITELGQSREGLPRDPYPYWHRIEGGAYLLFLGSYPSTRGGTADGPAADRLVAGGEGELIETGLQSGLQGEQPSYVVEPKYPNPPMLKEAVPDTDRVFARLLVAWLSLRTHPDTLRDGFHMALHPDAANVLPFARRVAADQKQPHAVRCDALRVVAQFGTPADLPLFESFFENKDVYCAYASNGHGVRPTRAGVVQVRDVAVALALLLCYQYPFDFGFENASDPWRQENEKPNVANYSPILFGFSDEKLRPTAHAEAKAFLAKQKENEPEAAAKLVKQLGAAAFADREAAAKQLRALGVRAEPALKAALKSEDPEIQRRVSKTLSEIRGDRLQALVKEFDPAKEQQPDHSLWRRFRTITGNTRAARDLFASIIKNPNWLRRLDTAEGSPNAALQQYQDAVIEVGKQFQFNDSASFHIPVWPCDRGEEVAFLLFLGSYPDVAPLRPEDGTARGKFDAGEGRIHSARGLELGLQGKILDSGPAFQAAPVKAAEGTDRVFARLLASWLEHRAPEADLVPDSLWLAARHGAKDVLPFARTIAADNFPSDPKPSRRLHAAALALVARVGTREDLPLFEQHFENNTVIATFELEDGMAGSKGATQLRDAAFGLALVLHGEDPAKYGFVIAGRRRTQTPARMVVGQWNPCAFGFLNGDDKARLAAHAKAKAFLDKQPKIEPKPAGQR